MSEIERDDELLAQLRSLLERVDPVPDEVTEFARSALAWRRIDGELAELLADSALERESAALARSATAGTRWLTFRTRLLAVDVEIESEGSGHVLRGQLTPTPVSAAVEVEALDGSILADAAVDKHGRFRLEIASGGRLRLRILIGEPPSLSAETSWLTI